MQGKVLTSFTLPLGDSQCWWWILYRGKKREECKPERVLVDSGGTSDLIRRHQHTVGIGEFGNKFVCHLQNQELLRCRGDAKTGARCARSESVSGVVVRQARLFLPHCRMYVLCFQPFRTLQSRPALAKVRVSFTGVQFAGQAGRAQLCQRMGIHHPRGRREEQKESGCTDLSC